MVGGFEIEPGIVLFSTRREMLRFGAGLATYPNKVEALKSRGECVFMRKGGGIQTLLISKQSQRQSPSDRQTDRDARSQYPILDLWHNIPVFCPKDVRMYIHKE